MNAVLPVGRTKPEESDIGGVAAIVCVAWWALAAIPSASLGLGLFALGVVLPLMGWRLLPVMLLGSFFFHSTMAVPADWLYLLRVYWMGVYFLCWLATSNMRAPRGVWLWFVAGVLLVVWGLLMTAVRLGDAGAFSRSSLVDALATLVWLSCILIGARFYADFDGVAMRRLLTYVAVIWLIGVGYGVRQLLLGFGPETVPQDIFAVIQGTAQYEVLGRRTFTFLSSNGIAIVSVLPICMLLSMYRHRPVIVFATLGVALAIWALTLTRSFAILLFLIVAGLAPVFRISTRTWLAGLAIVAAVGGMLIAEVGLETLTQFLRFAQLGDATRTQIWDYTLEHLSGFEALFGIGYGTAAWEHFFAELYGTKVLQSPHSALLEVFGQFGVGGLIFYLVLGGTVIKWVFEDRARETVLLSAALALVLLREQVATTYVFAPNFLSGFFWLVFGMAFAQHAPRAGESRATIGE